MPARRASAFRQKAAEPLANLVRPLRRPSAEALAGLHAEFSLFDLVPQVRVGTGSAIEVDDQHLVNGERQVEANEIGLFERAEHGEPRTEAVLDHRIDCLRIGDAGRQQRNRLTLERMLQPVANETRNVLADMHRAAANGFHQVHHFGNDGIAGGVRLDDLDQRHQMRRVPELRAENPFAVLQKLADVSRTDGRGIAGEDRVLGDEVFQISKELLLDLEIFRRRFDHDMRAGDGRRELIVNRNAFEAGRIILKKLDDGPEPLR